MTADVELLPSSVAAFTEALKGERGSLDAWLEVNDEREVAAHVEAYTRANVAHATAAKDAEIEALRAEVRQEQDYAAGAARRVLTAQLAQRRAEAQAERMAEALQWYAEQAEGCRKIGSIGETFRKELDRDGGKRARAALRDHDQEGKDG